MSLTAEGSVLGTPPYMSPEQVEGRDADARSDIFAFGVVLYELTAGTRPFNGRTQASLVASILREEPRPLFEIQPRTPRGLAEVVRTCLEKDPERRWQSVRDVRHALRWMAAETPPSAPSRSARVWQGLAVTMAIIAAAMGAWMLQPKASGSPSRFEASVPDDATPYEYVSVSPDGRTLAVTGSAVWLRDLAALDWRRLPGTEGAARVFWSPDGRYLGFVVKDTVMKIDTTGGPPETVATFPIGAAPQSGAWSREGDIVLGSWAGGSGGPIWRVAATGGTPTPVTQVDLAKGEFVHTWPTFLSDGRSFLYFRSGPPDVEGMYVASLDVDAANQSRQRILATSVPAALANGQLLFLRAGTLMAQPFDARRLALQDAPVPVAENVEVSWYFTGSFSVSDNGVFVYKAASPPGASGLADAQVLLKEPGLRHFPTSWSRDGRFLLYHTENAPNTGYDVWALSVGDRKPHLLLGQAFNEWAAVFSPDMRWVTFVSLETTPLQVYVRPFRVSEPTGQPSLGEGKWQISKDFGNWPQWRSDREIVFNTAPAGTQVFAAAVNPTGAAFESGVPQRLPFPPSTGVSSAPQSSLDGRRYLIEVPVAQRAPRPAVSVVLDWPALVTQ